MTTCKNVLQLIKVIQYFWTAQYVCKEQLVSGNEFLTKYSQ